MSMTLESIVQLGQRIVAVQNLEATANNTAELLHANYKRCGVALWQKNGADLKLIAAAGAPVPFSTGETCLPEEGLAGWVAAHSQTAVRNGREPQDLNHPAFELGIPIKTQDRLLGVLSFYGAQQDAVDDDEVNHLELLAGFVAVALANALQIEQLQQELTEHRETTQALRQGEEMFRQVVASISAHIYVTEVTQDGTLVNHYIAPNVEPLTGFPSEKFIEDWGFWPNHVIFPEDRGRAAAQFRRLREGLTSTAEYRLRRADGAIIWVRDSGRVENRGTSRMIYGVVSDITDRKEAELALERERTLLTERVAERTGELSAANAQLARAARLKDEFLANMSHELRTPLNAILGMSEVLQSGVYGQLNPEQLNAARHIQESGGHLLSLITDILDLSKIEADKLTLDVGPVFIDYVCEASLRMVTQVAGKKRIKISSQLDERVKSIQADQRRLKQILVNLLSNAVKFTPEGGRIGLYVQGDQEHDVVRFVVWDTGIGIAEKDMSELFKPFVQLDSKLSKQHEGSGLGLSLVSRLAEMHGGGVSVESELGKGSRFTVSLPWHKSDSTPLSIAAEATKRRKKTGGLTPVDDSKTPPLILLAEDNEANVITLTEFLRSLKYRVIVARNGDEAIKRAAEERPNIVLMDIQMPGMDGLEATRRIRADDKLATLPVVALTALAMPGDRERCIEAGANDYLSKPVSLKRLIKVIEAQLQRTEND